MAAQSYDFLVYADFIGIDCDFCNDTPLVHCAVTQKLAHFIRKTLAVLRDDLR